LNQSKKLSDLIIVGRPVFQRELVATSTPKTAPTSL